MKKNKSKEPDFDDFGMDDTFSFIAGYTSCGYPYGTKCEEVGINPSLPFEEKINLYLHGCYKIPVLTDSQKSDLKVMLNTLDDIQVKLEVYGDLSGAMIYVIFRKASGT